MELRGKLGDPLFQLEPALEGPRLLGGPGADLTQPRAGGEVGVGLRLVAIGDDSGTFASTSPETAPTTCEGCIAEAHFEEHAWEQEIELQALSANPSGAHLTAASPFLPGSEAPVEVVVIVHP